MVVAIVIAIAGLFFPLVQRVGSALTFAGVTNYDAITLDSGNLTVSNGNIVIAKTTGTTTISSIGCHNVYPTSTATVGHFVYGVIGTTTVSGTSNGSVQWQYGVCP